MHGKTSLIHHNGTGIFNGIDRPFTAMRYHSLVIDPQTSLDDFLVTALRKIKMIITGKSWLFNIVIIL